MTDEIRLLHVDDPEFVELAAESLGRERGEYETFQASTAEEGLAALDRHPVDCIVSGYELPGPDGIEFLRQVREDHPQLPFVLLAGRGSEAVASEAISAGVTDYFPKERIEGRYDLLAERILDAVSSFGANHHAGRAREYRTLVEESPVPMTVVDASHEIRYVNRRAVETLGADDASALVGESLLEFLSGHAERSVQRLETVLNERETVEVREYEFTDVAGNVRYGRGTIVPVTFDGEPAAQVVTIDITERKRQEQRVHRRHDQITKLCEVGVEIAGCESKQDVYDLVVEAAERILELDLCIFDSVEDGTLVAEATSSELTEYEEAPIEEAGLAGRAYLDGESHLVHDSSESPDAEPVGEFRSSITVPVGEFGVFQAAARETDAFDERDLELVEILAGFAREALVRLDQRDRLQRENERLDQFASIVSHDIRNPLNVAQLQLDLAMEACDSDHLDAVARSIDRIETLTDELLGLARVGEISERVSVDLEAVVRRCWDNVETAEATLSVQRDARIEADEARLQQLLENLLRNAIEHGGEDVTVSVGLLGDTGGDSQDTAPDSEGTALDSEGTTHDSEGRSSAGPDGFYVEDDGAGIDEAARDRLFESGFSTRDDGTGFGLAIVSRAAGAHGWEVTATESEAGGARFEFTGVEVP